MKKIKVMNLIWHMGDGGAQQIVLNYLRAFQNDPDLDFCLYVLEKPTNSKYDREIKENNYPVVYLNDPRTQVRIPILRGFCQRVLAFRHWKAAFAQFQPDIVHIHMTSLVEQVLPAILYAKIPVRFATLHSNPYRQKGKLRWFISDAFQNRNVTPICLTEEQSRMAKAWYGIKDYELVRNGMDFEGLRQACCSRQEARAYFGLDPDAFTVIGMGRLNPIKNFPLLIESFAELLRIRPDAQLVIAGDGAERGRLQSLVEEKNLSGHVIFLGNITEISKLYSAADVLGVTSVSESLSLVALEAQICGLRCVLSDGVPEESILLENTRKLPAEATPEDWAKALLDTEYTGSTVFPMELYDNHQVNRQIKEIYRNRYHRAMQNRRKQKA